jgi:LysM repeat protein
MINLSLAVFDGGIYIVEEGDTLASIAKKFSTSKELIVKENFLKSEVRVGDYLLVRRYEKVYTVGIEDTLSSVSKILGASEEELLRINKTDNIYPFMQVVK